MVDDHTEKNVPNVANPVIQIENTLCFIHY